MGLRVYWRVDVLDDLTENLGLDCEPSGHIYTWLETCAWAGNLFVG